MSFNLYKISQDKNQDWNTYVSAVVCAEDEQQARHIHPDSNMTGEWWVDEDNYGDWVKPDDVKVALIGITDLIPPGEVICSNNTGA